MKTDGQIDRKGQIDGHKHRHSHTHTGTCAAHGQNRSGRTWDQKTVRDQEPTEGPPSAGGERSRPTPLLRVLPVLILYYTPTPTIEEERQARERLETKTETRLGALYSATVWFRAGRTVSTWPGPYRSDISPPLSLSFFLFFILSLLFTQAMWSYYTTRQFTDPVVGTRDGDIHRDVTHRYPPFRSMSIN